MTTTAPKIPATIAPENVVAIVDSREQLPLDLSPLRSVVGTLTTGDYGLAAMPGLAAIERKSLGDFLSCVGQNRERFEREVQRLLAFPVRCLVIESTWQEIEAGEWRSKITPAAAVGSLLGWIASGLPVIMAGNHTRAGQYTSRLLYTAARRRYCECRELLRQTLDPAEVPSGVL